MITPQMKSPATVAAGQGSNQNNNQPANDTTSNHEGQHLRPGTKRAAILQTLLELGELGMNCFEAANRHHDYVLRSTISDLGRYGLRFDRQMEQVPNSFGKHTDCMRYWISPTSIKVAKDLLGILDEAAA